MSTQVDERTDIVTDMTPETTDATASHIVKTEPGKSAAAIITEARVFGTLVEALCGYMFIPMKDPSNYPLCSKCKEIYEVYKTYHENLHETPNQ